MPASDTVIDRLSFDAHSGTDVTSIDLVAEHGMGALPTQRDFDVLTGALGIPPLALTFEHDGRPNPLLRDTIVRCGPSLRVRPGRQGEDGVLPAFTLLTYATCRDPLDIVAYRPKPNLLLSLLGCVTVIGEDQVLRPHLRRGLRVHRTLGSYLAHRRRGIVVMNFTRAALLLHGIRLIPEDEDHREELRRELVAGPIVLEPGKD